MCGGCDTFRFGVRVLYSTAVFITNPNPTLTSFQRRLVSPMYHKDDDLSVTDHWSS